MIFKNILLFWAITFHRMEFLLAPCSGLFHRPKLNVLVRRLGNLDFWRLPNKKKIGSYFREFRRIGSEFQRLTRERKSVLFELSAVVSKKQGFARILERTTVHLSNRRQIRKLKTQQCIAIYFGIICTIFSLQVESPFPWFITFVCLTAVEI